MSRWEYTEAELWRFGNERYAIYHVFGTLAIEKTVLVFAEARQGDGSDAGSAHDIRMRKSTDGGKSFGEDICLMDAKNKGCFINPTPLYDAQTKRILLVFGENHGNTHTSLYLIHSDDEGEHWSLPREITASVTQKSDTRFHVPGPGHGIQLKHGAHAGRLLLQLWHRGEDVSLPRAARGYCASLLYSDDHGNTWQHTAPIGKALCCNESRLCETAQDLLWTLRSYGTQHAASRSVDGGVTWEEAQRMPLSPANACDAGLISLGAGGKYTDTVLLSRISGAEKERRRDMEICISTDGGKRFDDRLALMTGDAMPGYSDLCVIDEDSPVIGLVHCRNDHVLFSRISMQTLTAGKYDGTSRKVWKSV